MRKYRLVAKKGEGTFSEVLKAQNVKDGKYHAIKCMKNRFETIDQVNNLREIQALRRLSPHDHIVSLEEVLYDQPTGRLALVFELMDANLYELIKGALVICPSFSTVVGSCRPSSLSEPSISENVHVAADEGS
jgi:renal tumor antigen